MKNLSIIYCLLICAFPLISNAQTYTLDEALAYALVNQNDIKRNALDRQDAAWQVKEYWASGLPTVSGNVAYQYFFEIPTTILPAGAFGPGSEESAVQFGTKNNLTAGLSANALLFDGGFLVGLKAQKAYKDLIESQIGLAEQDIRTNVTKAYLNVVALKEARQLIQDNITSISKTRNETNALYENGFAEQLDVDRLDLTIQNLKSEQQNLEQYILSTKEALKFQMGYPMEDDIMLTDDMNTLQLDKPLDENISIDEWSELNRIEFSLLDQTIGLNDINIRAIKAQYLPTLTASVNYNQALQTDELFGGNNRWFPTGIVGLNLAIPIYDGGDKRARIARAKIDREGFLLQREDLSRSVALQIKTSSLAVETARRNVSQRKSAEVLAEKIYNTTLIKYKEGVGSSLEVNQAEIDMLTAQRSYIDAIFEYLNARTDLERALGKF